MTAGVNLVCGVGLEGSCFSVLQRSTFDATVERELSILEGWEHRVYSPFHSVHWTGLLLDMGAWLPEQVVNETLSMDITCAADSVIKDSLT